MLPDIDLFSNCGLRYESEIYTDGSYSLSRVEYQGRKLVAEVSDTVGAFQHRWPSVQGLMSPLSARDLPGQKKMVLFDIGDGVFLYEKMEKTVSFTYNEAVKITQEVVAIISDLQAAGMICGYIGPEMFISQGSSISMLAGRRGIPVSPFTAPEVKSSRPSDPRSDVSAIGSFLFRLVAGTDDREKQLIAWQKMNPALQTAITDMVAASPVNRPNGLKIVMSILEGLLKAEETQKENKFVDDNSSFVKESKVLGKSKDNKKLYWIIGSIIMLILIVVTFLKSGPPDQIESSPDIVPVEPEQQNSDAVVSPWVDTVSVNDTVQPVDQISIEDSAVIWVSNCSGISNIEQEYRSGPVSQFSFVYPLVGTTNRQTSLILVRRDDPMIPIGETANGRAAYSIADSSFAVKPVDLTILLGTDLNYPEVNGQFLQTPVSPAGTLFVDVVNHGVQFPLEGMGAATWTASRIEGKSVEIQDVEWLIAISDIRDSDRFSEDIGIPAALDETVFLFSENNHPAASLETLLRQFFRPLPGSAEFLTETVPIADIHILMGRPASD